MQFEPQFNGGRRSADIRDIAKLWKTIQTDFPGKVRISIEFSSPELPNPQAMVLFEEEQLAPDGVTPIWHVWSSKTFTAAGYLISWGQLFDLLIVGYTRWVKESGQQDT